MSNKWSALGFSIAALAFCSPVFAGPKPVAHSQVRRIPAKRILMPHLRPGYGRPGALIAGNPNMTQMPESHLIAGLKTDRSGPIYTDTRGKTIGRMDLRTGKVVWFGRSPRRTAHPR